MIKLRPIRVISAAIGRKRGPAVVFWTACALAASPTLAETGRVLLDNVPAPAPGGELFKRAQQSYSFSEYLVARGREASRSG